MAYRSLLTILTDAPALAATLDAAAAVARRFDAHLDVFCLGIDRTQQVTEQVDRVSLAVVVGVQGVSTWCAFHTSVSLPIAELRRLLTVPTGTLRISAASRYLSPWK